MKNIVRETLCCFPSVDRECWMLLTRSSLIMVGIVKLS